jgi:hypothetical protein
VRLLPAHRVFRAGWQSPPPRFNIRLKLQWYSMSQANRTRANNMNSLHIIRTVQGAQKMQFRGIGIPGCESPGAVSSLPEGNHLGSCCIPSPKSPCRQLLIERTQPDAAFCRVFCRLPNRQGRVGNERRARNKRRIGNGPPFHPGCGLIKCGRLSRQTPLLLSWRAQPALPDSRRCGCIA